MPSPNFTLNPLHWIADAQRTHALEHATIQMLTRRHPGVRLSGRSTPGAFYVYGDVPLASVQMAVGDALARLRGGAAHLAIHPHCGTNLVVTGALTGLLSFLTMLPGNDRSRRERLPLVILACMLALILAQPLGPLAQQWLTTRPDLERTEIVRIVEGRLGAIPVHRIELNHRVER